MTETNQPKPANPNRQTYVNYLSNHLYELTQIALSYEDKRCSTYSSLDPILKDTRARLEKQLDSIESDLDAFEAGLRTTAHQEPQAEAVSA